MGDGGVGIAQKECAFFRTAAHHASLCHNFGGGFWWGCCGFDCGGNGRCQILLRCFFNDGRRRGVGGQNGRFGSKSWMGGNGRFGRWRTGRQQKQNTSKPVKSFHTAKYTQLLRNLSYTTIKKKATERTEIFETYTNVGHALFFYDRVLFRRSSSACERKMRRTWRVCIGALWPSM